MDRALDPPARPEQEPLRQVPPPRRGSSGTNRALSRERETLELRGYKYQVSASEMATLREIGQFRTIALGDLAAYRYQGQKGPLRDDLKSLASQGLIQRRRIWLKAGGEPLRLVVLTKIGLELVKRNNPPGVDQTFYSGLVKKRELAHDSAIYPMYQAEAQRILGEGGQIRRIILDHELKRTIYRPLAKIRPHVSRAAYTRKQAEVAAQHGLKVVNGKILLPDLRIEYDTRDGARTSIDLELATEHYRGSAMRGKAEAGFRIYAAHESAARLAARDPELIADILSF